MAERRYISVAVPDDLMDAIELISSETGRSLSASFVLVAEKGLPVLIEEMNKMEVYKNLIAERKAKGNDNSTKASKVEDNGKQKVKDKSGDSKSKK